MQKIVIFDWGGVVLNHENNCEQIYKATVRLIRHFNKDISEEEILENWTFRNSLGHHAGTLNDEKSIKDWVNTLEKVMNIDVEFEVFKEKYEEEFGKVEHYKEVVEYIHSLKDKCKIGILSNLNAFDRKRIDEHMDFKKFDYVFLSFEIGIKKPDREVYEYVSDKLKVAPENILFIDDKIINIKAAESCGWKTCNTYGYELEKIKEAVNKFLQD